MTSTHPLHLQSLHNHHNANPGPWGRAGFFPNIFSITRRHTNNDVHASFASPVTSQSS